MTRWSDIELELTDEWCDITDTVDAPVKVPTLAKPDGVGALQFSLALYRSGKKPDSSVVDLVRLLDDFAAVKSLGRAFARVTDEGSVRLAGASFHSERDLIRVWYVSDGWSFALVTYVCAWAHRGAEMKEAEAIVRSLRFVGRKPKRRPSTT